jgi:putative transposase
VRSKRFANGRLGAVYPYLMLDALYIKEHGMREVNGVDVIETESHASWLGFLRSLVARGLRGVNLVVSDAAAASWRRCRVHFLQTS